MCGIVIVFNDKESKTKARKASLAQQSRAKDEAGMTVASSAGIGIQTGPGIVTEALSDFNVRHLNGSSSLVHIRYSTSETTDSFITAQPLMGVRNGEPVAFAHNGHIINANSIRLAERLHCVSEIDSEVILRRFCKYEDLSLIEAIKKSFRGIVGSYSCIFQFKDSFIAVRDNGGNRPQVLASLSGGGVVVASETSAVDAIEGTYLRSIEKGEILHVKKNSQRSYRLPKDNPNHGMCSFEDVYIKSPASLTFTEKSVSSHRKTIGRKMAQTMDLSDAEIVCFAPDSATFIGQGFAEESGLPLRFGFMRSHFVNRTFIDSEQKNRNKDIENKFGVVKDEIAGKKVILIDDSIVRLTTMPILVRKLRNAGAAEIHIRIASPPIYTPCNYGVDTKTSAELIANRMSAEEICQAIRADSLEYISIENFKSLYENPAEYCYECWIK